MVSWEPWLIHNLLSWYLVLSHGLIYITGSLFCYTLHIFCFIWQSIVFIWFGDMRCGYYWYTSRQRVSVFCKEEGAWRRCHSVRCRAYTIFYTTILSYIHYRVQHICVLGEISILYLLLLYKGCVMGHDHGIIICSYFNETIYIYTKWTVTVCSEIRNVLFTDM